MPLLDRYLVQIWEQSGGCAPRFVPFSEIRDLIYEEDDSDLSEIIEYVGDYSAPKGTDIATDLAKIWDDVYPKSEPDGKSISERMDALDDTETGAVPVLMERADAVDQQLFETQGMADKLAAIELRKDGAAEILENKNIVNPQINETPVRAYFDIALSAPATKAIRISAITPGTAANSYTYEVIASKDPDDVDILWGAPDLVLRVLKDDDERIITTAYELARLAAVTPDFVSNFIISFDDGTLITEDGDGAGVIAAADSGSFANGAGADHVLTSTGTQIDNVVTIAPASGAPITAQVVAKTTYDTDKITFTAKDTGAAGNGITVEASCRLSATLGSGDTEITLTGEDGLYPGSTVPLVSVQIVQAATESPLVVSNQDGIIVVILPADANNDPIYIRMSDVIDEIQSQMQQGRALYGVIAGVTTGASYDPDAKCVVSSDVPFEAASNTVEENDNAVLILLAYDGGFDGWETVVTEVNDDVNSTLVTASAGAQSEAEPFDAMSLAGGLDITAGAPGAIRYEATKIWISVAESTASESNWKSADLTDPNA